jgi:hypothetical protein
VNHASLLPYANEHQTKVLKACIEHGSARKAAKALGINNRTVDRIVERLKMRAAARDPKLHAHQAPPGYTLRGASTLLDANGEVVQTWVKTAKETQSASELLEVFRSAIEDAPLRAKTLVPGPKLLDKDLLAVYPMGDPHLGMLAWRIETGEDFDVKIAERNLCAATERLVALAPPAHTALLINVGDFFHSDNSSGTTTAGTRVDTDSRWSKVLQIGINTMIRCIDCALEKHAEVVVINEIGNHDAHTAIMLSVCLAHHYRNNPRVKIDVSPSKFHWYEFGLNLIGVTHGDTCKAEKLPGVMATDRAEAWGRTKFRRFYTGHVHHESVKEFPGCTVETMRTLASKDAWHAGQGYRSGRSMVCDVHHRTRGRILRHEIGIEDLE